MRTPLQMQNHKSEAQKEAKKKSYSSPLKKGWFIYVILIGYRNYHTQRPQVCGALRVTNEKNLRINHSSCTEKQPMRNRATRQLIALWLFEAW